MDTTDDASDLLTKEDIAALLSPGEPLSVRSVERYIAEAGVEPAVKGSGRGKVSKFHRADVDKIVAAYRAAQETREGQTQAIATRKPDALTSVALVAELAEGQRAGFEQLKAALDVTGWPVWMRKAEALERSGLPVTWLEQGTRKGELPHAGSGRAWRVHRDDLREFAEKVRSRDYLTELLKKSDKPAVT